jgi:hypothetical protein
MSASCIHLLVLFFFKLKLKQKLQEEEEEKTGRNGSVINQNSNEFKINKHAKYKVKNIRT